MLRRHKPIRLEKQRTNNIVLTAGNGDHMHGSHARDRSRHKDIIRTGVRNMNERNMGTKGKVPN